MEDLTGFQRDLLVVAVGMEEPNGLDLKSELETYYTADVNHGRLYPNLDALVEKGLLEKRKKDERTNCYVVTDRGTRAVSARREWEDDYVADAVGDEQAAVAD